mgnify:CR=1 FL=1
MKNFKGEPLSGATIRVSDRRHDVTTAKDGDYWRLLVPGSYEITATAKDYEPQTKLIEVMDDGAKELNFTLRRVNDKAGYVENEADFLNTAAVSLDSFIIKNTLRLTRVVLFTGWLTLT